MSSFIVFLLVFLFYSSNEIFVRSWDTIPKSDADLIEVALNLEYLEAEFFLYGAEGYGLDVVNPNLTEDIIFQFGLQEVGHLRAIKSTVRGFSRPLLNISSAIFGQIINNAFGKRLEPPFDPYANDINYLIASYVIPYVGLNGYVGANPLLQSATAKAVIKTSKLIRWIKHVQLVAGLLGVESGQDAIIRGLLYERRDEIVIPYKVSVTEFTNRISNLRNKLGREGIKDEGLVVPKELGAEGEVTGNILSANDYSLSYPRTPKEILRIVYGTGDEHVPGGFYPLGANGTIAKSYLERN
ncbi:hypothetical protein Ahy_B04g070067 isoform B [Arachis hypogaea]|uniref:Desiccation-related protein PCC13-62 n=1 Tax=Arachis hypogaea TaxID=3818 RepID=A0A444ZEM8_ARAHY|nr:hypothetical protein Ahy_B04g070067 isoform B [Arachis hypogaea]